MRCSTRIAVYPATGNPNTAPGFLINPSLIGVDTIPQTFNTTLLGAAQVGTHWLDGGALATVAVTNFSAGAASIAFGVPFIPNGTTTPINVIALDFGFTTGTTVANSSVVTCPNNTLFQIGQWVVLGNVANAAGTASLITQVQSLGSTAGATGSITVGPGLPATALGCSHRRGQCFRHRIGAAGLSIRPVRHRSEWRRQGFGGRQVARINPAEKFARGLQIQVSTNSASGAGSVMSRAMTSIITS